MNFLRSVFPIAIIVCSFFAKCVHAAQFKDDPDSILQELALETIEDRYSNEVCPDGNWARLANRNKNDVAAACGQVIMILAEIGQFLKKKSSVFKACPGESGSVTYVAVDLPVQGMSGQMKKVVRISNKPFTREKKFDGTPLEQEITYKNGLFIADSYYDMYKFYVFAKPANQNTLVPILTIRNT